MGILKIEAMTELDNVYILHWKKNQKQNKKRKKIKNKIKKVCVFDCSYCVFDCSYLFACMCNIFDVGGPVQGSKMTSIESHH